MLIIVLSISRILHRKSWDLFAKALSAIFWHRSGSFTPWPNPPPIMLYPTTFFLSWLGSITKNALGRRFGMLPHYHPAPTTWVTPSPKYCSDIIFRDHLKGSFVRDNDHFVCHTTGARFTTEISFTFGKAFIF